MEENQPPKKDALVVNEVHPMEEEQEQTGVFDIVQNIEVCLQDWQDTDEEYCFCLYADVTAFIGCFLGERSND